MQPSKEQIENAARLVLDEIDAGWSGIYGRPLVVNRGDAREWQPWAYTEAGRSDALVLLAAVCKWAEDHDGFTSGDYVTVEQANAMHAVYHALYSGNHAAIQQATMAAAIAIGQHMARSGQEISNEQ